MCTALEVFCYIKRRFGQVTHINGVKLKECNTYEHLYSLYTNCTMYVHASGMKIYGGIVVVVVAVDVQLSYATIERTLLLRWLHNMDVSCAFVYCVLCVLIDVREHVYVENWTTTNTGTRQNTVAEKQKKNSNSHPANHDIVHFTYGILFTACVPYIYIHIYYVLVRAYIDD